MFVKNDFHRGARIADRGSNRPVPKPRAAVRLAGGSGHGPGPVTLLKGRQKKPRTKRGRLDQIGLTPNDNQMIVDEFFRFQSRVRFAPRIGVVYQIVHKLRVQNIG